MGQDISGPIPHPKPIPSLGGLVTKHPGVTQVNLHLGLAAMHAVEEEDVWSAGKTASGNKLVEGHGWIRLQRKAWGDLFSTPP